MNSSLPRADAQTPGRNFYIVMALAVALATFVGFAPTYFLKRLFDTPPLPSLVHAHGLLFTAWVMLLIAQASLVRAGRVQVHRRLGMAGVALAALMVGTGVLTAIGGARRGIVVDGMDPLAFLAIPLAAVLLFALFVTLAVLNRSRPEYHKRLMLLGTFSILTPALARLWFVQERPPVAFALTMVFVLSAVAYDLHTRRRVHPVYVWGGLLVLVSGPIRFLVAQTPGWQSLARVLVE